MLTVFQKHIYSSPALKWCKGLHWWWHVASGIRGHKIQFRKSSMNCRFMSLKVYHTPKCWKVIFAAVILSLVMTIVRLTVETVFMLQSSLLGRFMSHCWFTKSWMWFNFFAKWRCVFLLKPSVLARLLCRQTDLVHWNEWRLKMVWMQPKSLDAFLTFHTAFGVVSWHYEYAETSTLLKIRYQRYAIAKW